jgi:peptide-methionine (S)-S-oxide reductase
MKQNTAWQNGLRAILIAALMAAAAHAPAAPKGARPMSTDSIVLGGGCFWCVEAVYERIDGIVDAVSGYSGGQLKNPSYEQVSYENTGHAEVVKVEFDPAKISLEKVLELFWKAHDPTTLDRQGGDVGSQYRSIILYKDEAQRRASEASKQAAQAGFRDPIVTELVKLETFWPAEDYHQDYFEKNPQAGYCVFVIKPKLDKLGL